MPTLRSAAARLAVVAPLLLASGAVALAPAAAAEADPVPGDPLTGTGEVPRTVLTATDLTSGTSTGPVPDSAFALPAEAAPPQHTFEGTLTLTGTETAGGSQVVRDWYDYAATPQRHHLPPVSVTFVQNGSHLIPAARGLRFTGSPVWNLLIAPGRAWSETGDGGMSRASVPFALIERNANCTHNGVLTFLFDQAAVSHVRYQVTAETCLYLQLDLWGQVPASYQPQAVPDSLALRSSYAAEVAGRLPVKPVAELATDYPEADVDPNAFGAGITPSAMSSFGLQYGGVTYAGGCATRYGTYAHCDQLLLPSYSTAKSVLAGLALLRLAQRFGEQVADELVPDHVPETATLAAWQGVTFGHALNMATGNYDSPEYFADEGGARMQDFFLAEPYAEKMSHATGFPDQAAPGTTWVYQTSATFVVAQAMDAFLHAQDPGQELFAMLRDEVLVPAGVGPDSLSTLRTGNNPAGAALGGYGMFWTRDGIAKVARLINDAGGVAGGEQVLHPGLLAAAMQRDPASRGMDTSGTPPFKYQYGFWAHELTAADDPELTEPFWVPFMSGFGGITVAMMPNGADYWYFSDNDEFVWFPAVSEAHKVAPMDGGPPSGCAPAQLVGNGSFETGTAAPWTATPGVVDDRSWLYPAHTGAWKAWLNGYGYTSTDTLAQTVTIPGECATAQLELYLWIDTSETVPDPFDTLALDLVTDSGAVAVDTWTNLDASPGYQLRTFDLSAYLGQTITLRFTGQEDYSHQTSFLVDEVALHVS